VTRALSTAALAAILACGCCTVESSHDFRGVKVGGNAEPIAVLAIENSGWYFLGCLPILTGNPDRPGHIKLFSDTVTLENNIKMLSAKARQENATEIANLASRVREDLAIGFFIFGRKQVFTSAVIMRPAAAEKGEAADGGK